MLKLEKLRGHEISISLRSKNRSLNKDFWRAFFIAALIHLSGLIFFRIGFLFLPELGTLPAIEVKVEMNEGIEVLLPSKEGPFFSWLRPIGSALNEFRKEEIRRMDYFNAVSEKEFFHLHLCGMLADLEVDMSLLNMDLSCVDCFQQAVFQVEIEGKSGKIFWMELKDSSLSSNVKEKMKDFFSKLEFKNTFSGTIYSGDIEVSLYPFKKVF